MNPFHALYGRPPPHLVRFSHTRTVVNSLEAMLQERDAMLDEIQFNLLKGQQVMKHFADLKRREVSFVEGDLVFLKLQPYRQKSLAKRPNEKLAPRFFGPYSVLQKIDKVAYKLDLPPSSLNHPVFHVSQLKLAQGFTTPSTIPPPLSSDTVLDVVPVALLAIRHPSPNLTEVLVHWQGLPRSKATWENYDKLLSTFPSHHLEDKVKS